MKSHKLITGAFALAIVLAATASADTIGYSFTERWDNMLLTGKTADGFSQWTDSVDSAAPNGTGPANSTDAWAITTPVNAAMVSVAWASANTWHAGREADPEQQLYRGYLDDGDAGPTITITGLSTWLATVSGATGYRIDIYRSTDTNLDANDHFAELNIYGGPTITDPLRETFAPEAPAAGGGGYPTESVTWATRLKQTTTGTFSDDIITIHSDRYLGTDGDRAGIAGFKITTIPEPGTLGMVAVFGGGILFIRRKLML